jgi:two-component system phosphate regulon sensor histidine kinase PhoR
MLQHFGSDVQETAFSTTSKLAIAISQSRQVQQQLEQEIFAYQQILQAAPVGYLQVDDENRLIWCNGQARSLLGISAEQPSTKPRLLLELVRSYELDDLIEQTRIAGNPCQSRWTFYPVNADPSRLSEQQAYAVCGYGVPLQANQVGIFLENHQEVLALLQQRDRWASDLAHEFKTPLTSIRLVAETLQTRLEPTLRGWVDRLIDETIRLSNLVQDLLDLNRLERGTFHTLQLKTVDLVQLIQGVWESLEPLTRKKHLHFDYSGPDSLLVQIDPARIHRLFVNLLDNSIKYSPTDAVIQLKVSVEDVPPGEVRMEERQIRIDIIDSGSGFPEKALPHVFERFYRADPSRARSTSDPSMNPASRAEVAAIDRYNPLDWHTQGGSGLGLAIVRQIVEAHHGSVSARNHPETGGAWLQVRLPWQLVETSSRLSSSTP